MPRRNPLFGLLPLPWVVSVCTRISRAASFCFTIHAIRRLYDHNLQAGRSNSEPSALRSEQGRWRLSFWRASMHLGELGACLGKWHGLELSRNVHLLSWQFLPSLRCFRGSIAKFPSGKKRAIGARIKGFATCHLGKPLPQPPFRRLQVFPIAFHRSRGLVPLWAGGRGRERPLQPFGRNAC